MSIFWDFKSATDEENEKWAMLRAMEWSSFPFFISPLFFPFLVIEFGWLSSLIVIIVLDYIWAVFVSKAYLNLKLSDLAVSAVAYLKWPVSVVFAIIIYLSTYSLIESLLILLFPILSWFLQLAEIPLRILKITEPIGITEKKILTLIGYSF